MFPESRFIAMQVTIYNNFIIIVIIIIIVFSLIALHNQIKVNSRRAKKANSIQYCYRKWELMYEFFHKHSPMGTAWMK